MKYDERDQNQIADRLLLLAEKEGYDKIVLKVPDSARDYFLNKGYKVEAKVLKYYQGKEDCYFLSRFLSEQRSKTSKIDEYANTIKIAKEKEQNLLKSLNEKYSIVKMDKSKIEDISKLYKEVFKTYPFPVFDPEYIGETMNSNVVYFGVYTGGELVALASSEIDEKQKNAEMTDFAIKPGQRGKQLAKHLLKTMEQEMLDRGIITLYTIARAESLPMNCTFASLGYINGGTLINNTQISGEIESMNIWYKCN